MGKDVAAPSPFQGEGGGEGRARVTADILPDLDPLARGTSGQSIIVRGVAASGVGKAAYFTRIPWVAHQFSRKLRLAPWPGTFNVRLTDARNRSLWEGIQRLPGIQIDPPDASACVARCYPVLLNGQARGAIVVPHVAGYPPEQIEVIAEENLRARLNLNDGDPVTLEVLTGRDNGI